MHRRVAAGSTHTSNSHNGSGVGSGGVEGVPNNGVEITNGSAQLPGIATTTLSTDKSTTLSSPPPPQQQQRRRRKRKQSSPFNPFSSMYGEEDQELAWLIMGTCFVLLLVILGLIGLIHYKHVRQPTMTWWEFLSFAVSFAASSSSSDGGMRASPIYTIPNSMPNIGDKSDAYATLRKEFDMKFPLDTPERSLHAVQALQWKPQPPDSSTKENHENGDKEEETTTNSQKDLPSPPAYDIYNCPYEPPMGYPHDWSTLELLDYWPPDTVEPPHHPSQLDAYQGICVFDYYNDYTTALNYRKAELPYVVRGDPLVAEAVERWNTPGYLSRLLTDEIEHRTEFSKTNHFLFWLPARKKNSSRNSSRNNMRPRPETEIPPGWAEPTKLQRMTYGEWLSKANATNVAVAEGAVSRSSDHQEGYYYFRLIGCGHTGPHGQCDPDVATSEWLFDELEFFQPRANSLYLVNQTEQRGIHCRFGSAGIIAENHFDGSLNSIVVLGGARRYILSHPDQCEKLALFPPDHPSARHSSIEWDANTYREHQQQAEQDGTTFHPEFQHARSNQVVLQPGDVLFLPTHWFHFIVSLAPITMQCNTRSGKSTEYLQYVERCGF